MKRLGEKLRILRNRRELTLRELGELLDVDYGYVGRLERGEKIPNLEMLLKLADLFQVSLDQLAKDDVELD